MFRRRLCFFRFVAEYAVGSAWQFARLGTSFQRGFISFLFSKASHFSFSRINYLSRNITVKNCSFQKKFTKCFYGFQPNFAHGANYLRNYESALCGRSSLFVSYGYLLFKNNTILLLLKFYSHFQKQISEFVFGRFK